MGINVIHRFLEGEDVIRWARDCSGPALDDIWKEAWLQDGIGSRLNALVGNLEMAAGAMRYKCDRIVLVAEGAVADMLEAMLFLAPEKDRVKLVRGTLSAGELSRVIEDLEQGSAGLIGVAMGEESPSFCAVFATLRKLIADRYSQEKKDRLKAIYGRRSTYLSEEMERGDMEGFRLPEAYDPGEEFPASASPLAAGTAAACLASSVAMIFPMMVAGINAGAYVRGFIEMLASPWWDRDADQYGLYLGSSVVGSWESGEDLEEDLLFWQPELRGVCRWMAAIRRAWGAEARALCLPEEAAMRRPSARATTLFCEEEEADIMLPAFPGVSPEGSLHEMTREAAEALYQSTGGTMIRLDRMDAEELGRLMAYLQLSFGIAGWLPRNQ